jgi:glycosyltransferase involved in cell wall biosynthesis
MSSSSPTVTALLPAYNAAAFIDETLQSLAAQTYPHFRVLISVDVSVDDTIERCERFACGDERFVVLRQATRQGWVCNSRALLRLAESDLCFFIGHDDVVEPDYVETLVAALATKRTAVLAYSDMGVSWPNGRRALRIYGELDGVAGRLERGKIVLSRNGDWWTSYRGIFRTQAARHGQPLRRNLAGEFAADWPFLLHFALQGECIRVPRLLYHKRRHKANLSSTWTGGGSGGELDWMAVGLCCGILVLQADLTSRERLTLLRRIANDILQHFRLAPHRWLSSFRLFG